MKQVGNLLFVGQFVVVLQQKGNYKFTLEDF